MLESTEVPICLFIKSPPYQHVPIVDYYNIAFEDALINGLLIECLFGGIDINATGDF